MSLPQHAPGSGGHRPRVHFTFVSPMRGKNWHAYSAGPCHWYLCHTKGKSQPCLHEMTGGELSCKRCDNGEGCELIGYQPLYRESDSKPVMVILHEYAHESVAELKLHARVIVGRDEEQSAGVYVRPALKNDPVFQTRLSERMRPAELTETLLRVWRLEELVTWYRQTHGVSSAPTPKPSDAKVKINGRSFRPDSIRAADQVGQAIQDGASLDAALDSVEERWKAAAHQSKNGHKPK